MERDAQSVAAAATLVFLAPVVPAMIAIQALAIAGWVAPADAATVAAGPGTATKAASRRRSKRRSARTLPPCRNEWPSVKTVSQNLFDSKLLPDSQSFQVIRLTIR